MELTKKGKQHTFQQHTVLNFQFNKRKLQLWFAVAREAYGHSRVTEVGACALHVPGIIFHCGSSFYCYYLFAKHFGFPIF